MTIAKYGEPGESCILLSSHLTAVSCQDFLASRSPPVPSRLIQYPIRSTASAPSAAVDASEPERVIVIHAAFFAAASFSVAKQFWQHTGDGISSRTAERCLTLLGAILPVVVEGQEIMPNRESRGQAKNRHYAAKPVSATIGAPEIMPPKSKSRYAAANRQVSSSSVDEFSPILPAAINGAFRSASPTVEAQPVEDEDEYLTRYVEERYGRNLDLSLAPVAKLAMRRRLAGVLGESNPPSPSGSTPPFATTVDTDGQENIRGVAGLTEDDVWLYSCGMSAIFHAHQLAMGTRKALGGDQGKSICFG